MQEWQRGRTLESLRRTPARLLRIAPAPAAEALPRAGLQIFLQGMRVVQTLLPGAVQERHGP